MLKPLLLSLFFAPKPSTPQPPPSPVVPEQPADDAERARSQVVSFNIEVDPGDNNELDVDINDDDQDVDAEVDEDDPEPGVDDDIDTSRPGHRPFRRGLSISRTMTSFSALVDIRRHDSLMTFSPFAWFDKLMAHLRPSESITNDHLPNYRVTPILSGIVIPFSILLEIPGFTEHWYIKIDQNNKTVETKTNPLLLEFGLAFGMFCAVAANACLVARFMEKRVKVMTILCVIFLTVHDIINILALTIFGVMHSIDDGFTYGQSFWMTVCSTVVSFITNVTLIVDLIRTPDFSKSGSGLTRKQGSLVVIVIILLSYIALGAMINSFLGHLTFINALYFTIVTIETIGFGDIRPANTSARIFICFYAVFGILNLALLVGVMRDTVLEGVEVSSRRRLKAIRERRKAARIRRRIARRWREAIEWRLRVAEAPIWVKDDIRTGKFRGIWTFFVDWFCRPFAGTTGLGYGHGRHPHGMHLGLEALTRPQLEAAAMETGVPLETLLPPGFKSYADADSQSTTSSASRGPAETIVAGITGLWREMRPREGHGQPCDVEGQPATLTHARMGRMVAMLGRFALAMHSASRDLQAPPLTDSLQESSPTSQSPPPDLEKLPIDADVKTYDGNAKPQSNQPVNEQNEIDQGCPSQSVPPPPPHWTRPSSQQANIGLSMQHFDSYRLEMENEEKKAFLARVTVAWVLFIVFWAIGSGVFVRTEGWSVGTAVYFCFITFTTIGFGDWSPQTPAGRSVFVVWALLGVGTMTILISVISEAYSFRYKHALLHTHVFDSAVKRYRQRMRTQQQSRYLLRRRHYLHPHSGNPTASNSLQSFQLSRNQSFTGLDHVSQRSSSPERHARAQQKLETLPSVTLQYARTFHEQVQFFLGSRTAARKSQSGQKGALGRMPEGLKKLLREIADPDMLGEQITEDILNDDNVRKTLFALSIERQLRNIVQAAEDVLDAMEERDNPTGPCLVGFAIPEIDKSEEPATELGGSRRISRRPSTAGEQTLRVRANPDSERASFVLSTTPAV